jgi:hypothetical protein
VLAASTARADAPVDLTGAAAPRPATAEDPVAERRCGVAAGIAIAGALGGASGFPNDAAKIGRPEHESDIGTAAGAAASAWVGVALADWLVFGIGPSAGTIVGAEASARFGALGFHVDLFPAYALGDAWRELGVVLETGIGLLTVPSPKDEDDDVVDSGAASRLGLGVFYEGLRVWQLSMGPFVSADLMWSPSATRPLALAGFRTVVYGGP